MAQSATPPPPIRVKHIYLDVFDKVLHIVASCIATSPFAHSCDHRIIIFQLVYSQAPYTDQTTLVINRDWSIDEIQLTQ